MAFKPEDNRPPLDPSVERNLVDERVNPVDFDETDRPAAKEFEETVDEIVVDETPIEEVVYEEAPVEEVVYEEAPVEEVVYEETPVEEVFDEDIADQPTVKRPFEERDTYNDEFVEQPKKKNKLLLFGVLAVIIALVAFFALRSVFASPKGRLTEAVENLKSDSEKLSEEFLKDLGINAITKSLYEGKGALNYDFNVKVQEQTMNMKWGFAVDAANKLSAFQFNYGMGDKTVLGTDLQLHDDQISISIPQLLDKVLGLKTKTIGADIANSKLVQAEVPEDIKKLSIDPWAGPKSLAEFEKDYLAYIKNEVSALGKDTVVKKSETPVKLTVGDKEQTLDTFDVQIPVKGIGQIAEKSLEYVYSLLKQKVTGVSYDELDKQLEQQKADISKWAGEQAEFLNLQLGIDANNRFRYFETNIDTEDQPVNIVVRALGADNPLTKYESKFQFKDNAGENRVVTMDFEYAFGDQNKADIALKNNDIDLLNMQMVYDPSAKVLDINMKQVIGDPTDLEALQNAESIESKSQVVFEDVDPGKSVTMKIKPEMVMPEVRSSVEQPEMDMKFTLTTETNAAETLKPDTMILDLTQEEAQQLVMQVIFSLQALGVPINF